MNIKFINSLTATIVISLLLSCNNDSKPKDCFKTKQDSLNFVKAVIKKYPEAQGPKIADFGSNPNKSLGTPRFNPVDWAKIQLWAGYYDVHPLIANKNGFFIDARGLGFLKNNSNYKQVFLRFGKYTDSDDLTDYTVMIIPLNADSTVLWKGIVSTTAGANNNYDELDPCPNICPKDF